MANVEEDNKEENNKHEPAGETGEDELAGELEFGSDNEKEEEAVDVNGKGPSAEEEVVVDRKNVRGEEGRSRESTPKRSARGERQEESPRPIPVSPKRSARDSTREGTPKRSARGDEQENRGSRDGTPKRSARGEEEEQKEGSPREKVASRHSSRGSARSKKEEHSDDERYLLSSFTFIALPLSSPLKPHLTFICLFSHLHPDLHTLMERITSTARWRTPNTVIERMRDLVMERMASIVMKRMRKVVMERSTNIQTMRSMRTTSLMMTCR